jgi:hypothetical protein
MFLQSLRIPGKSRKSTVKIYTKRLIWTAQIQELYKSQSKTALFILKNLSVKKTIADSMTLSYGS